jgi:hypothetical protein
VAIAHLLNIYWQEAAMDLGPIDALYERFNGWIRQREPQERG